MTRYEQIKSMSLNELALFLAKHVDHYRAPKEVNKIYENHIGENGRGVPWFKAFEIWLESEVTNG